MAQAAGVDGCRGGWVVVTDEVAFVCPDFGAVLDSLPRDTVVAVDIPIGLEDGYVAGGRRADSISRRMLGQPRGTSVFPAPARCCFGVRSLEQAREHGCRINKQGIDILKKIEDVDSAISPALQERVYEVHPEVSFAAMNGDRPLPSRKTRPDGRTERRDLLERADIVIPERPRPYRDVKEDDLLDACVARWSALRIASGTSSRVPDPPPMDARGLRMEICW